MWSVIQKRAGKENIVFVGHLAKAKAYMKKIRDSQRKGIGRNQDKVEYRLEKTDEQEKYVQEPHNPFGKKRKGKTPSSSGYGGPEETKHKKGII